MPFRIDLSDGNSHVVDRLVQLGAIDIDVSTGGGIAALMPDSITPEELTAALGLASVTVSPAVGRDEDSVWVLSPPALCIGALRIVPADMAAAPGTLRLSDSPAFGTGLHPTTALCIEALQDILQAGMPDSVLDIGTGTGILALAALAMGVPRATGTDIAGEALRVASDNARLNGVGDRLQLTLGGPESLSGTWPVVVANILAATLIEMAPTLVRRVGHHGQVILSGIPNAVEHEVTAAYRRLGMSAIRTTSRGGWAAVVLRTSW